MDINSPFSNPYLELEKKFCPQQTTSQATITWLLEVGMMSGWWGPDAWTSDEWQLTEWISLVSKKRWKTAMRRSDMRPKSIDEAVDTIESLLVRSNHCIDHDRTASLYSARVKQNPLLLASEHNKRIMDVCVEQGKDMVYSMSR